MKTEKTRFGGYATVLVPHSLLNEAFHVRSEVRETLKYGLAFPIRSKQG
ncbi:hypothetical protein [[Phormidium] sp. LEGE 05292]|nr:hypothetical protein [Phormidium sp. LEGE 05292]